ncbi:alpha-E domain-containing protein [Thiomicrospira microaerophila]|uniref:alpha-E domain-containing protein n=1 Tax=Thiomicrospira microaerophila TaxID=406020 RepID=UPI001E47E1B8|nr:alpha-E domain-containing protein [Thiomicrospira microaerophila]
MMLSRVAERVFWLARYIERVENTARMVLVHSNLMYDLPKKIDMCWYRLIELTSSEELFAKLYDNKTEKSVMQMLLVEPNNPGSLMSSLKSARENIRTTRDILPKETWNQINQLHLLLRSRESDVQTRSKRNALMEEVIQHCQAMVGMFAGTLSQDETFAFLVLGRNLERADMTSRMLDEGGFFLGQQKHLEQVQAYENVLWANILRSVSGYLMYRQHVQTQIEGEGVIKFLLNDRPFPRSVTHCLLKVQEMLDALPDGEGVREEVQTLLRYLQEWTQFEAGSEELHAYLDHLQQGFIRVNNSIYQAWFIPKHVAA